MKINFRFWKKPKTGTEYTYKDLDESRPYTLEEIKNIIANEPMPRKRDLLLIGYIQSKKPISFAQIKDIIKSVCVHWEFYTIINWYAANKHLFLEKYRFEIE